MRCALLLVATLPALAESWTRAQAGQITVFTDTGARSAAETAQRLDRLHAAFLHLYPGVSPRPVQVLWFARRADYAPFAQGSKNAGISYSGPLGEWIVADASATEPQRVLAHELGHLILTRMLPDAPVPHWLAEGFAETYSTLEVMEREIRAGLPIPAHQALLARRGWSKLADLGLESELVYAQGWALARQLVLREPGHFGKYLETREIPAGLEARAQSLTPAVSTQRWSRPLEDATAAPEPEPRVRRMSADLLFAAGRGDAAREILARIVKSFPSSEEGVLAQAILSRNSAGPAAARQVLEQALERRIPGDAALHAEYIALLEDLQESPEAIEKAMRNALVRHPELAQIEHRLGQRLAARGHWEEALERLRRSAEAEPRNFSYWHAYGWALRGRGEKERVREISERVQKLAVSVPEREMASVLANEESPPPAPAAAQPLSTAAQPLSTKWRNPQGDATLEGTLVDFICAQPPELEIESQGRRQRFRLADPARTPVRGRESFEFRCGAQRLPLRIEYQRETLTITAIELR